MMAALAGLPPTLDRAGIEALIPHRGPMCLLAAMLRCDDESIECSADNHRDAKHPLRTASGLLATALIEYAAQAMALHGALVARADGGVAPPGFLASARGVELAHWRLDDLPPAEPDLLRFACVRQAADPARILYSFTASHGGRALACGRIAVVLSAPPADSPPDLAGAATSSR